MTEYVVTSKFEETTVGQHRTLNLEMAAELVKVLIQMSSVTDVTISKA